ncbi:sugar phosphate isomerase/epimerase family protein [Candidatus Bipolaricaulota sp. J31]
MWFGINIWSYPKALPLEEAMAHAADAGYEAFEVAVTVEDWERWGSADWRKKWEMVGERAKRLGISVPSVATGLFWRFNLVAQPEDALRVIRIECEVARLLGARLILVVPGTGVSSMSYEEHIRRAAEALREAAGLAHDYGVRIGLENVWNRIFAGPLEFKRLLEEVGDERVGAYFDVGNTLPHSLPEHWIGVLREWIFQVHVKDYNIAKGDFGIPLTGDVNWPAVRKALEEVGYEGYILPEVPPYPGDPYQAAEDARHALRKVFGR